LPRAGNSCGVPYRIVRMESKIPASVGRYRIESELGRGAMGAVYRGVDPKLDRVVAIKMISSAMAGGEDQQEIFARFEREARVSAKLQHANVVAVYDVGTEGEELYLVMELVDGETLGQVLAQGRFPEVGEALEWIAQAADALGAAHEAGIIHRDVKPGNLMLTRQGRIKVADFGVAKAVGEKTDLTRTGMMVGSPAYMSPEQVKGMSLDGRSDLFSLGVVLYEMLLRRKPFPADTVTTLVYQILHEDPMKDVPIPDAVSADLADFLRWTLSKDREMRIPDARTFAMRARSLAAGQPQVRPDAFTPTAMMPMPESFGAPTVVTGRGAAPQGTTRALEPRSSLPLWIGVGAAVLLGAGLGGWLLTRPRTPAASPTELAEQSTVVQVQATERPPAPPPTMDLAEAPLTVFVPDERAEEPPAESSGDGLSAPTPRQQQTLGAESARPRVDSRAQQQAPAATETRQAAESATAQARTQAPAFTLPAVDIVETYEARRFAEFRVRPSSATVTINGVTIGIADDWDNFGGGKPYPFPYAGDYYVELAANGYESAWIRITIKPDARDQSVRVNTRLKKSQ
jgi:eukaryotic-like serine/threonine-protein kinase